ncbi:hypothetical protein CCAX7_48330 [Capsulimonas corticalis]|uniref:Uncharacterized protein n=1 Tax=Capsulimonas corticalis TaxID=2219043 RepID=A0A402CQ48_9BACT|nr:DUF3578 domain-containing protein [Capsulimonas corticalis]BDI32782.1 hypothetical protein CCAX7_48330 [Capsulimonas corticalis]
MPENSTTAEQRAAQTIAALLPDARQDISVIPILAAREEVLARFGAIFQPDRIASLELAQYRDFLKFENNKHWRGFLRRGVDARDIEALRAALTDLLDEGAPIAGRIDRATARVPGLSVAIATAILHIVSPAKYAPWSRTSAQALERLKLRPKFTRDATAGEKYEAINAVVVRLAERLSLHLWDLDTVFQYFVAGPTDEEELDEDGPQPPLVDTLSEVLHLQKHYTSQISNGAMRKRGHFVTRVAPKYLREFINPLRFPNYHFEYEGSNGNATCAKVPYVRIYSPEEAPTVAAAYSLVYLFAADGSAVYLSLNHSASESGVRANRERVNRARSLLLEKNFRARGLKFDIDLKDPRGQMCKSFEEGNVFAIEYKLPLPDESVLQEDLSDMLHGLYTIYHDGETPALAAPTPPSLQYSASGSAPGAYVRETPSDFSAAPKIAPPYSMSECAEETGISEKTIAEWLRAIERKGQAILYGPPGTGKTYAAQRLAKVLIAETEGFVELVQFHPSYAYEDFIYGIRPTPGAAGTLNLEPVPGRFVNFCRRARGVNGACVLIIDEINRANLSRVFGELMYLLEYRKETIDLAIGVPFSIPENVRIIGTMNTADRSLAVVDHALRRRFAFFALAPNYETLRKFHRAAGFPVDGLIGVLNRVNDAIDDPHYHIGISYFLRADIADHLPEIWTVEIEPYLEEFFFDQPQVVTSYRWPQVRDKILHG